MKKLFFALALIVTASVSFAQEGATRPARTAPVETKTAAQRVSKTAADRKQDLEKLIVKLNATEAQATKMRAFGSEFFKEKDAIKALEGKDAAAYKAKENALDEAFVKNINSVLTAEQQKSFAALIAGRDKK